MVLTKEETAIFACGCFWGVEYAFSQLKGISKVTSGYCGCKSSCITPSYQQVCNGTTGCAESVEFIFDPSKISYETLVQFFFSIHNSTTQNRQGPDIGSQYRSEIFYLSLEQKKIAEQILKEHQKELNKKIVTKITKATPFYKADEYHQKYVEKHGKFSCHIPTMSRFLKDNTS